MLTFPEWSDDDLTAQAVIFLAAGFDTVATAMTFLIYELAVNHDIQQRLYQEIMDNEARNGGKIDDNSVQNMVYMDMVVSGNYLFVTHGVLKKSR